MQPDPPPSYQPRAQHSTGPFLERGRAADPEVQRQLEAIDAWYERSGARTTGRTAVVPIVVAVVAIAFVAFQHVLPLYGVDADRGGTATVPPTPATQGRYDVTVEAVSGEVATLVGARDDTNRWRVVSPEVRSMLQRHVGEQVTTYWRTDPQGVVTVVGVVGARGTVFPDEAAAATADPPPAQQRDAEAEVDAAA